MFNLEIQRNARFREELVDMETTIKSLNNLRVPSQTKPNYAVRKDARSTKVCSAFFYTLLIYKSMN